mmetsp:Transcript_9423/g.20862  ORF Transcript_9423/g.20862 Transcript_9423/m.20862 type:complete len:310 (-) Transcript_9423:411-1340(-)
MEVARFSRWIESATSTAPPPATRLLDSIMRLMTHRESCRALSISSSMNSLAPLSTTVHACPFLHPLKYSSSPSPTLSSQTVSHSPRLEASNTSFPSRSAMVTTTVPPVALAMRFRSSFFTRRIAMAPASTKYLRHRSSMPLVVRITLAPASRILWIFSLVMSISLCRISSTCLVSVSTTCTPICSLCFCRLKSSSATLTPPLRAVGMAGEAREQLRAKPSTSSESRALCPCDFSMWMLPMGHLDLPSLSSFTVRAARTARSAKNLDSAPMILEDIEVVAALIRFSLPRVSALTTRFDFMYLTASFTASR